MPTPTIGKIRHLKGVGVFADLGVGKCPHDFKRYNLIYGFNGCGKTTLSRMLESISELGVSEKLAEGAEFSFLMSDGSTPSYQAPANAASRYIDVFNEDYVERSLTWTAGEARPIIYLGKEQAELAKKLAELEASEASSTQDEVLKSAEWSAASRALETHCRDAARLIAEELSLGRRYNASNIKADYDDESLGPEDKLGADERKGLRDVINRSDLPPKLVQEQRLAGGDALGQSVVEVLGASVADIAIESLQRRKDALTWVEEGLRLHADERECLFCGNDLLDSRKSDLQEALQGGFERLTQQLASVSARVAAFRDECRSMETRVLASPECLPGFRGAFDDLRPKVTDKLASAQKSAENWFRLIDEKRARPDKDLKCDVGLGEGWDAALGQDVTALNEIVRANNEAIENFASEQQEARRRLKRHYLADCRTLFLESAAAESETKLRLSSAQASLQEARTEIAVIRGQMRTHGPAADQLNDLLKGYLGHNHITLQAVEDGYRICRDGKPSCKPLSEGEKTAVAFCYFLTALNSEGRRIQDLIIVLDDPISSLDARAMTHVVSMVRRNFANPAQLFILTHNLDFMREMKKWLNKRKEDGVAEFLFVELGIDANGDRSSSLVSMPKLIREYESEYHYLYSLMKGLAENPNDFERFAYLMPNALRKVLDIFLAFKEPGSAGLESKVDKIIAGHEQLDAARVKAMERLAHLESHSESIGDVTTFSAYTLEQVADAAKCLLELIEVVDPQHHRAMARLCRP